MFTPYETSFSLWLMAVPDFEWESGPPADAQGSTPSSSDAISPTPATDDICAAGTTVLPPSHLVFKGLQWVECPVWSLRENPTWERMCQDQRDEDERRIQHRARGTRHLQQAADVATAPVVAHTNAVQAVAQTVGSSGGVVVGSDR